MLLLDLPEDLLASVLGKTSECAELCRLATTCGALRRLVVSYNLAWWPLVSASLAPATPTRTLDRVRMPCRVFRRSELIAELQILLNAPGEADLKRLLTLPHGLRDGVEVQCDVERVALYSYRCHLRLGAGRSVCIFEACKSRTATMRNSQYRIRLPASDDRMLPVECGPPTELSREAVDAALYCGKMRAYGFNGLRFVAYDDGAKRPSGSATPEGRGRRQLSAVAFTNSSALPWSSEPMQVRILVPTPSPRTDANSATPPPPLPNLLRALHASRPGADATEPPPEGTSLLRMVPPKWNADEGMFQVRDLPPSHAFARLRMPSMPFADIWACERGECFSCIARGARRQCPTRTCSSPTPPNPTRPCCRCRLGATECPLY